jgi:hypothetical protein
VRECVSEWIYCLFFVLKLLCENVMLRPEIQCKKDWIFMPDCWPGGSLLLLFQQQPQLHLKQNIILTPPRHSQQVRGMHYKSVVAAKQNLGTQMLRASLKRNWRIRQVVDKLYIIREEALSSLNPLLVLSKHPLYMHMSSILD